MLITMLVIVALSLIAAVFCIGLTVVVVNKIIGADVDQSYFEYDTCELCHTICPEYMLLNKTETGEYICDECAESDH